VSVLDKALDTLEGDPDFSRFFLDGQTCLIEDYLEIHPEYRSRITALLKAGRLEAGPWFTMPDQFLCSCESLIQNLLMGHKIVKDLGGRPVKYGYVCDIFGHAANLPQILRGFDIKGALVGRGTNRHTTPMHFKWQSPDGSWVAAFKLPEEYGYGTFWYQVIRPFQAGDINRETLINRAKAYVEWESERANKPFIVLTDGMDHEDIHPITPYICRELAGIFNCPVETGSLEELAELLQKEELPLRAGELNELTRDVVEHSMLITYCLSSRYDLKRANDICQHRLEKYAFPAAAFLAPQSPVPPAYFEKAYRYLLLNHAHDSICGCSIDAVHKDMLYRFRQALELAEGIFDLYFEREYKKLAFLQTDEYVLGVFNPLPYAFTKTISADIWFEPDDKSGFNPYVKYEQRNQFKLYDRTGAELKYTIKSVRRGEFRPSLDQNYNTKSDINTVVFTVPLSPLGMTYIRVVPREKPVRYQDTLSTGDFSAENNLLGLSINSDGTFNISDKANGMEYRNQQVFLDNGESGDGWFHIPPIDDRVVSSLGCEKAIEKVFDGTDACSFRVTYFMKIPEELVDENKRICRSGKYAVLEIVSLFTITRSADYVSVDTRIKNFSRDHRLRVRFDTGVRDDSYYANQTQAILKRTINSGEDTHDWKETGIREQQFENLVFKRDSQRGLAFISAGGLHEASADSSGALYITLFRSFSKTFLTNGESDGQLQGDLEFRYAVLPLNPRHTHGEIIRIKDKFVYPPKIFTKPRTSPSASRGFELHAPDIGFDLLKPSMDGAALIARFTNYSAQCARGSFFCPVAIKAAVCTNFLEEPRGAASFTERCLTLELRPFEIKSYKIILKYQ
jgi:hypothetical protein